MLSENILKLAYSPCPNDTFIFYNLVHKKLLQELKIEEVLLDVEELNISAEKCMYDASKLSFFAIFKRIRDYKLLNSGSALGNGCGPLLVKKKGRNIGSLRKKDILVPGLHTTANLLTHLFLHSDFRPIPMRYDLVAESLLREEYELGVIIHEERFTYISKGLEKVEDLGEYWEGTYGYPIPLGGICVRRNFGSEITILLDKAIKKSIEMAYENPSEAKNYILENSQEKDETVVQKHIDLYVNKFSLDLGDNGKKAIEFLLEKAISTGLVSDIKGLDLFSSN